MKKKHCDRSAPHGALPSLDDLLHIYTKMTGRVPTPDERAECQVFYNTALRAKGYAPHAKSDRRHS
jgi:hypothetical protein